MDLSEVYSFDASRPSCILDLKIPADSLARTLHDVSFPDSGGGFGYYPVGSLKNRFLIWRSHGDNLELQEISVDDSTCNNMATISFSGSAVVGCVLLECSKYIDCLVCTSNGVARISFPKPNILLQKCSIFSDQHLSHFYQIKGLQPHLIRVAVAGVHQETGDGVFVYGLSNGSILVAHVPLGANEITESFEVHQTTIMQKLWNGIVPFTGKSEQDSLSSPSDMAFVTFNQENQLLLSVCRDHFLRLWDLKHRHCLIATNLLDFLPDWESCDQKQANLQAQYASGIHHRISRTPLSSSNGNTQIWLIYVFLSPAPSLSSGQDGFDVLPSNYWFWVELNMDRIQQRDRYGLRVLSVTPVTRPPNAIHSTDSVWQDTSVLDFIPIHILNPVQSDHNESDDEMMNESSENANVPVELDQETQSVIHGVWWIAHETDSRNETLESTYQVCWSAAPGHQSNCFPIRQNSVAAAPGWRPYEPLLSWRRTPPVFEDIRSGQTIDSLQLSETIESFLDFMFEPGRLSWFSIWSTLKSLRDGGQLRERNSICTANNTDELRSQVWTALTNKAAGQRDATEFLAMLKAFYATAVDYHEHALQPLGMFQIPYDPILLSTMSNDGTKEKLPFAPGLVIVRRWGFSLLRPLIPLERMLWNPQLNWSPEMESDSLQQRSHCSNSVDETVKLLLVRCVALLRHLCADPEWSTWESALYGTDMVVPERPCTSPSSLAQSILRHLDELNGAVVAAPFCDLGNWKRAVFDLSEIESSTAVFTELVCLVEQSGSWTGPSTGRGGFVEDGDEMGLSTSETGSNRFLMTGSNVQSSLGPTFSAIRAPTFSVNFLAQALTESVETRMHFALSVLILLIRSQINPVFPDCTREANMDTSTLGSDLITRLDQSIRCLRVIRWLGRTRIPGLPDARKLSEVREHVNLLGFVSEWPDNGGGCEYGQLDVAIATQFPGSTVLEQILSVTSPDIPTPIPLRLSTAEENKHDRPVGQPWPVRCEVQLPKLSVKLNPATNFGRGLEPVFRHLILGGRASSLLQLNRLLAPSTTSDNADQSPIVSASRELDLMTVTDNALLTADNWSWSGDYSLLNLCVGLAHIWLGRPDLAKEDFINASVWLHRYVEAIPNVLENTDESLTPFYRLTSTIARFPTLSDLLLCSLFARSFAPSKLFCTAETGFSPDEAQIRFILKVLPVLETQDCVTQVVDLVEFALNRLATIRFESSREDDDADDDESEDAVDTSTTVAPWSRRITAVLTALHACPEDAIEGFLSTPDEGVIDKTTITGQLYVRLADLEAALWTRMFKHQLVLRDYTRAFMLIRSNPDSVRRRDCLRQFIVTLCDEGEAAMLVSFHYGAAEDEFLRILETRARATDVLPGAVPQDTVAKAQLPPNAYYEVLYAFHIRRANFREAAMTMFEYAYRLAEETACAVSAGGFRAVGGLLLHGLQRQASCLLAAINALYVVPIDHQWLVRPGMDSLDIRSNELLPDEWAFADVDDVEKLSAGSTASNAVPEFAHRSDRNGNENGTSAPDRFTESADINGLDEVAAATDGDYHRYSSTTLRGWTRFSSDKHILQLQDLLNLYILTRARLRLAQTNWEQGILRAGPSDPRDTVEALLAVALYDEAVRVAEAFHLDFCPIVTAVALRCAALAQYAQGYSRPTIGKLPALPGLSNLPAAVEYEHDLVLHALGSLASPNFRGSVDSNLLISVTSSSSPNALDRLYWCLLEVILTLLDPPNPRSPTSSTLNPGLLHLVACEHLLRSDPGKLSIPTWLVTRLQSAHLRTGRPVQLLRLFWKFDRVEEAYTLAMNMLNAANGHNTADPATFGLQISLSEIARSNKGTVQKPIWLPHNLLVRLLNAFDLLSAEYPACKIMESNLRNNLASYLTRLKTCSNVR